MIRRVEYVLEMRYGERWATMMPPERDRFSLNLVRDFAESLASRHTTYTAYRIWRVESMRTIALEVDPCVTDKMSEQKWFDDQGRGLRSLITRPGSGGRSDA